MTQLSPCNIMFYFTQFSCLLLQKPKTVPPSTYSINNKLYIWIISQPSFLANISSGTSWSCPDLMPTLIKGLSCHGELRTRYPDTGRGRKTFKKIPRKWLENPCQGLCPSTRTHQIAFPQRLCDVCTPSRSPVGKHEDRVLKAAIVLIRFEFMIVIWTRSYVICGQGFNERTHFKQLICHYILLPCNRMTQTINHSETPSCFSPHRATARLQFTPVPCPFHLEPPFIMHTGCRKGHR